MKNDPSFKFVAAVIIAGVVLAFANHSDAATHGKNPVKAPAAIHQANNGNNDTVTFTSAPAVPAS